jgi:tetratricopeptide (TPR) repeat protein
MHRVAISTLLALLAIGAFAQKAASGAPDQQTTGAAPVQGTTEAVVLPRDRATAKAARDATAAKAPKGNAAEAEKIVKPEGAVAPAQNRKYGQQLLEIAEAEAGGLEGGMRVYALLQLSRLYQANNKLKALELLENAMTAAAGVPDDGWVKTRERLREQILRAMVPMAPQRADELLPQVAPEYRGSVLSALLTYYQQNKQLDRGVETLQRIAQEVEVPYAAAERLMAEFKPGQEAEYQRVFALALASFRDHPHASIGGRDQSGDFGGLLAHFWTHLPQPAVREAIDELLKQAESADKDAAGKSRAYSMSSAQGTASFGSTYEYRLFQVLPILREIDSSSAEDLLKKYQAVASLLKQYPEGANALQPFQDKQLGKTSERQGSVLATSSSPGSVGMGGGGGWPFSVHGSPQSMQAIMAEMHRAQAIVADAEKHPQEALANMATVSDPGLRATGYGSIARLVMKTDQTLAHSALEKALDSIEKIDDISRQLSQLQYVAETYLKMEDPDQARKAIEKGLSTAEKAYKKDTDADDPNRALKAFWPSTQARASFLRLAGQISPEWALQLVTEISDPEVRVTAETAVAAAWLEAPSGPKTIMTIGKKASQITTSETY